MKIKHLLLLLLTAVFGGCSSAYRIGQTPDDVYYSPAPPPPVEYVTTDNQQDRDSYAYNNSDNSGDGVIQNRSNISLDFGFGYNPYDYYGSSLYSPYSSFYNPYNNYPGVSFYSHNYNYYNYYSPYNSYYYSPYNNFYSPVFISTYGSSSNIYTSPRTVNLGAYNTTNINRINRQPVQPVINNSAPVRTFPTRADNRSGVGNFIRRVFTSSDNNDRPSRTDNLNNNNNNSSPVRTIQTTTSGSSSSSSGSSSAPVRTFRR